MNLEELKKEYANQDNRATAFPIYVQVQELVFVGILEDGYSVHCPYGDGEERLEHDCENCEEPCFDNESPDEEPENCDNDKLCGYIWHPVEFFLTIKGAEEYMKANAHNHGKLRTYVHRFERRNFEMNSLLKELGFKVVD